MKRGRKRKAKRVEWGAVLVEGTVSFIMILAFFVLVTDTAIGIYRFTLLRYTTFSVNHDLAVSLSILTGPTTCSAVENIAETNAASMINMLTANSGAVFDSTVTTTASPRPVLTLTGTMPYPCIFCSLFSNKINLSTMSNFIVENTSFTCT